MEAWVTFATNDSYGLGALVVAASLKRVRTSRQTHCLITDGVTQTMREHLNDAFDSVTVVNLMDSQDAANLRLIDRPDLGCTFTKLNCWRLTQYSKCVFLDADTLVIAPCDELFEREEFSAAADVGWPDCFNSGVFVFVPNEITFAAIMKVAVTEGSFDGGDQGVLNAYFNDWRASDVKYRLPFTYNMSASAVYTYRAAYKRFMSDVKIVHFLGAVKPWNHSVDATTGNVNYSADSCHSREHVTQWWSVYTQDVRQSLNEGLESIIVGAPSQSTFNGSGVVTGEYARQRAWEEGRVDYLGKDSFENIQKRLAETMKP